MVTNLAIAQESTSASHGDTDVTAAIEAMGACEAVTDMLSCVGDKWAMQVVMRLGSGSCRFNELRRRIDGISQRMLTRTLRNLERDGLVSRTVTPSVPPRVDYALTALGHSLWQPVTGLAGWVLTHRNRLEQARAAYDARAD